MAFQCADCTIGLRTSETDDEEVLPKEEPSYSPSRSASSALDPFSDDDTTYDGEHDEDSDRDMDTADDRPQRRSGRQRTASQRLAQSSSRPPIHSRLRASKRRLEEEDTHGGPSKNKRLCRYHTSGMTRSYRPAADDGTSSGEQEKSSLGRTSASPTHAESTSLVVKLKMAPATLCRALRLDKSPLPVDESDHSAAQGASSDVIRTVAPSSRPTSPPESAQTALRAALENGHHIGKASYDALQDYDCERDDAEPSSVQRPSQQSHSPLPGRSPIRATSPGAHDSNEQHQPHGHALTSAQSVSNGPVPAAQPMLSVGAVSKPPETHIQADSGASGHESGQSTSTETPRDNSEQYSDKQASNIGTRPAATRGCKDSVTAYREVDQTSRADGQTTSANSATNASARNDNARQRGPAGLFDGGDMPIDVPSSASKGKDLQGKHMLTGPFSVDGMDGTLAQLHAEPSNFAKPLRTIQATEGESRQSVGSLTNEVDLHRRDASSPLTPISSWSSNESSPSETNLDVHTGRQKSSLEITPTPGASSAASHIDLQSASAPTDAKPGQSWPDSKPTAEQPQSSMCSSNQVRAATGNLILVDWKHKHDETLIASQLTRSAPTKNIYNAMKEDRPIDFEGKKIVGVKPTQVRKSAEEVLQECGDEGITSDAVDDVLEFLMPLAHGEEGDVERVWQKYIVTTDG